MFALLMTAAAAAAASTPKMLSTYDPPSIVQFLQDEGYKAKLEADKGGDPMIRSAADGTNFFIYFYGCEEHKKCKDLNFSAGFDFDAGKEPSLETIDQYNFDRRFVRAFRDKENDPYLNLDVLFTDGQMSEAMFRDNLGVWTDELARFKEKIGW